jgi:outer membrane protein assembly factor BamB
MRHSPLARVAPIEQRREREAITAYDVKTGRELWAFTYPARFDEILGGLGPRATPVYNDGLVYSLGANGDLYCLSAETGKPKWSKNILADNGAKNIHWAMSGSPLIVDQKVIVTPGGPEGRSIVAYKSERANHLALAQRPAGYASPILATRSPGVHKLSGSAASALWGLRSKMASSSGNFRSPLRWT